MYYECRQREYPWLPLRGHLQVKEKGEDPKPPGERQWKLNLVRWVFLRERHRPLRRTRPGGKVTSLRPRAPLGERRTRERENLLLKAIDISMETIDKKIENRKTAFCAYQICKKA